MGAPEFVGGQAEVRMTWVPQGGWSLDYRCVPPHMAGEFQ